MRIWDCHSHCQGHETGEQVLRSMDAAGVERLTLFSAYPTTWVPALPQDPLRLNAADFRGSPRDPGVAYRRHDMRSAIDHIASLQAVAPDRIFGLIWAEPRCPGMVEEIEYGIVDRGLRGVKLMPDHWSAGDELLWPIYDKMQELSKPIQFHSGVLYGFGDSSRFCRPVLFEPLLHWPRLRFALAHISYPWMDECIALHGRMQAVVHPNPEATQMWIDTCRGTPESYRTAALRTAVAECGIQYLMFGTDGDPAGLPERAPRHAEKDLAILRDQLGLPQEQIEMFFWGAAERFYGA